MYLGITIANMGERTCNGAQVRDYVISTNPSADDLAHLVIISGTQREPTVDTGSLVFYHHANPGYAYFSNCHCICSVLRLLWHLTL